MKKIISLSILIYLILTTAYAESTVIHINSDTVDEFRSGPESSIKGCVVGYDYEGEYDLYAAFYKDDKLVGADKTVFDISKGNNEFEIVIEQADEFRDCEIKYFLWDNMTPVSDKTDYYRLKTFSDKYEPYYPMITAASKSAEEIFDATLPTEFELTEAQREARFNVIKMYKEAGFDITRGMGNLNYNIFNIPNSWSTLTPKSLTGNYEQSFSVDACFNRKIPEDAPMTELNQEVLKLTNMHLAVTNTLTQTGGQGTGIARVIGKETDPVMSLVSRWDESVYYIQGAALMHVPENISELVNTNPSSDRHAIFIDDTKRIMKHLFKTVPNDNSYPYDIQSGRLPGYDIRGRADSAVVDLTGIGAEGVGSTYASYVVSDGMTIKPNEISNPDVMIEHAVSAAINPVMYGVVYPAMSSDCGDVNNASNFGAVPEGGLICIDKNIDLDALYEGGKLSLPSYKILKAVQEYGLYNVDRSGNSKGYGTVLYTSTSSSDWENAGDERFNVPYKGNKQGYVNVNSELEAFFGGDEFFGIGYPKLYVTIPVVKYAELDVDEDGSINENDMACTAQNVGAEINDTTKKYDINSDSLIDEKDVRVFEAYFEDKAQHLNDDELITVTLKSNDKYNGKIITKGAIFNASENVYKAKKGTYISFVACGYGDYEFSNWNGDFSGINESIVTIKADKDYSIGASYKKKNMYNVSVNASEGGTVLISKNGRDYTAPGQQYAENTLLYIKAVSDDGYILSNWNGDVDGNQEIQRVLVTGEIEINAVFEKGYVEDYSDENWECVTSLPDGAYTVDKENKVIRFNYSSFNYSPVLINKKLMLAGDWMVSAQMNNTVGMGKDHGGKIIFGYKDKNNYYYFYLGSNGERAELQQVSNGKTVKLAEYSGGFVFDGVSFTAYPLSVGISYADGKLTVKGYKNGAEITYIDGYEGRFHGRFGIGTHFHGYMSINNIKAKTSEIYGPYADFDEAANMLYVYGRAGGAGERNTLIINKREDNSLVYLTQYTTNDTGEYSFIARLQENPENYIINVRSGSEPVEVTPYTN